MNKGGNIVQPLKFKNKYRIASARLKNFDYSSDGFYFITICTDGRRHRFGDIGGMRGGADNTGVFGLTREVETGLKPVSTDGDLRTCADSRTDAIIKTDYTIDPIGSARSEICLSCWLDLPNHYQNCILDAFVVMPNHVHLILEMKNRFNDTGNNHSVSEIIRAFKTFTARKINAMQKTPGEPFWQSRFYDRIIRSGSGLDKARRYIRNNPAKWERDRNNVAGIFI